MKFVTYRNGKENRLAVVDRDQVVDINRAVLDVPADVRAALAAGIDLVAAGRRALDSAARA